MTATQQRNKTLTRIQNKIDRLVGEWESYAKIKGVDVNAVLRDLLELRELSKEQFLDIGLLLYLKVRLNFYNLATLKKKLIDVETNYAGI